ncbi:MAG: hypothetical protein KAS73_15320, partial [Candidatus Sabulitectum sp.]|nr:hypothetical protein [Candidatus Sabulitectum sp.]
MIIAERKPLEEIQEMVKGYKNILNVGCGGCTSICLAGGQKEVNNLNAELIKENSELKIDSYVIERQCNYDFFVELDEKASQYDAILSMACGARVQFVAERYTSIPVFPAL